MSDAGGYDLRSYQELADLWGVSTKAAKARVRRSGWLRVAGNSGEVRVQVPISALMATVEPLREAATDPLRHGATVAAAAAELLREAATGATDPPRGPPTPDPMLQELRDRAERAEAAVIRAQADTARAAAALDVAMANLAQALQLLEREQRPWWQRLWPKG